MCFRNSTASEQEGLLDVLWGLWEELPIFGRKAAQFVDLLGFFVLKTPSLPEHKVSRSPHAVFLVPTLRSVLLTKCVNEQTGTDDDEVELHVLGCRLTY